MLTNLDFLAKGQEWPPKCEVERLKLYETNRMLFNGEHATVYEETFKRIERVIGNFQDVVSYPVIINFQKKISIKTADFLWLEPPKISVGEVGSAQQKALDSIIEYSDLFNMGYQTTIDISRYGDGLMLVYRDDTRGKIDVTQPCLWFPIADPVNIKKITAHVLASRSGTEEDPRLVVDIHSRGSYERRTYRLVTAIQQATTLGDLIETPTTTPTGLSDFAVIPVSNVITSDRVHGYDDYMDVDSVVSELLVRVSQISRVLDKHANPSVQGPATALEKDPATGLYKLKMGNYFPRADKEDPPVEYVTWDGQLDSAFKQIEKLVNFLSVISEMGTALFDNTEHTGEVASGTALQLRYISVLTKVKRIAMRYTPALQKAIRLCSELGGVKIDQPISITWQDGLPTNDKEKAEIANIRTGGKPTMSQKSAIVYLDGKTDAQAQTAYEEMLEEDAEQAPVIPPTPPGSVPTEGGAVSAS